MGQSSSEFITNANALVSNVQYPDADGIWVAFLSSNFKWTAKSADSSEKTTTSRALFETLAQNSAVSGNVACLLKILTKQLEMALTNPSTLDSFYVLENGLKLLQSYLQYCRHHIPKGDAYSQFIYISKTDSQSPLQDALENFLNAIFLSIKKMGQSMSIDCMQTLLLTVATSFFQLDDDILTKKLLDYAGKDDKVLISKLLNFWLKSPVTVKGLLPSITQYISNVTLRAHGNGKLYRKVNTAEDQSLRLLIFLLCENRGTISFSSNLTFIVDQDEQASEDVINIDFSVLLKKISASTYRYDVLIFLIYLLKMNRPFGFFAISTDCEFSLSLILGVLGNVYHSCTSDRILKMDHLSSAVKQKPNLFSESSPTQSCTRESIQCISLSLYVLYLLCQNELQDREISSPVVWLKEEISTSMLLSELICLVCVKTMRWNLENDKDIYVQLLALRLFTMSPCIFGLNVGTQLVELLKKLHENYIFLQKYATHETESFLQSERAYVEIKDQIAITGKVLATIWSVIDKSMMTVSMEQANIVSLLYREKQWVEELARLEEFTDMLGPWLKILSDVQIILLRETVTQPSESQVIKVARHLLEIIPYSLQFRNCSKIDMEDLGIETNQQMDLFLKCYMDDGLM